MQGLLKLVEQLKKKTPSLTDQLLVNIIREYLQVIILKFIYNSKYANSLSFMGGTALRICYGLKRFSEDLDFALDKPMAGYSFSKLLDFIFSELDSQGYAVEISAMKNKVVEKAFVKLSKILHPLGLTHRESQKIHIKLEVDTNPIKVTEDQIESIFVIKFDEIFPILKHKIETSFAGKILAILGRSYAKGRDYYDLIWYLSRKADIDMKYLNADVCRLNMSPFRDKKEVFEHLGKTVARVRPETILKDIGRFLEDPSEEVWLKNYQAVFKQLLANYYS